MAVGERGLPIDVRDVDCQWLSKSGSVFGLMVEGEFGGLIVQIPKADMSMLKRELI